MALDNEQEDCKENGIREKMVSIWEGLKGKRQKQTRTRRKVIRNVIWKIQNYKNHSIILRKK